jgi:nucleoside-diphosphate-sugar epimerase
MTGIVTITGATGWLGKSTLEVLLASGHEMTKVIALASAERKIKLAGGYTIQAHAISSPPPEIAETEILIHLAYLTRDKAESTGFDKYVLTNLDLTSIALSWLEKYPIKSFVTVSSGARNNQATGNPETDLRANPYGFLKRIDELIFEDHCKRRGINSVITRLWGATGVDMQDASKYAIGDFVISALTKNEITITSGHKVVRRYVDSREFMDVCVRLAKSGKSENFDSGGPEVEIGELASEIARQLNGEINISRSISAVQTDDLYFPAGNEFENHAISLGIELSDISAQISNTIAGQRPLFNV